MKKNGRFNSTKGKSKRGRNFRDNFLLNTIDKDHDYIFRDNNSSCNSKFDVTDRESESEPELEVDHQLTNVGGEIEIQLGENVDETWKKNSGAAPSC